MWPKTHCRRKNVFSNLCVIFKLKKIQGWQFSRDSTRTCSALFKGRKENKTPKMHLLLQQYYFWKIKILYTGLINNYIFILKTAYCIWFFRKFIIFHLNLLSFTKKRQLKCQAAIFGIIHNTHWQFEIAFHMPILFPFSFVINILFQIFDFFVAFYV